jgi:hypothetical protein
VKLSCSPRAGLTADVISAAGSAAGMGTAEMAKTTLSGTLKNTFVTRADAIAAPIAGASRPWIP